MFFDRFDIAEAYAVYYWGWNSGAMSNRCLARKERTGQNISTGWQLHGMAFKASPRLEYETLSDNGKEIYQALVDKYES